MHIREEFNLEANASETQTRKCFFTLIISLVIKDLLNSLHYDIEDNADIYERFISITNSPPRVQEINITHITSMVKQ